MLLGCFPHTHFPYSLDPGISMDNGPSLYNCNVHLFSHSTNDIGPDFAFFFPQFQVDRTIGYTNPPSSWTTS